MAISLLAANNAQSVLAAGIGAAATTLTVNTGTGGLFPSPVSGTSFFKLTLIDAATGTLTEIVHVTQRVGDQMTIERGQEGTVARIWSANDLVANMMTAGTLSYLKQDIDGKLPKTGTAAAATKLATARTINGVAFDGSGDITLAAGDVGAYTKAETDTKVATVTAAADSANSNANGRVPSTRRVNGKTLSADITLAAGDVGAYTKAESDVRYQSKNTASKSESGWWKDAATGMITQWGLISAVAFSYRKQNITFPMAFPTATVFVTSTILGEIDLTDDTASIECYSKSLAGFVAYNTGDRNPSSYMWTAIGY